VKHIGNRPGSLLSELCKHKLHRIKGLHVISILQNVALNGINVECEHAPKHALNFGVPDGIWTLVVAVKKRGKVIAATVLNRTKRIGTHLSVPSSPFPAPAKLTGRDLCLGEN
jgi:hypothetical protein